MVILDPLGWWNIIREKSPDPTPSQGGRPGQLAGAQCLAPFGIRFLPVASGVF